MTEFATTTYHRSASGLRTGLPQVARPIATVLRLTCAECGEQPERWGGVRIDPPTGWCPGCWTAKRAEFAEGVQ